MASPVTQPATLHAIRQDNMAVHILRLSLFSSLVNNFLYASHFCHENAMGEKNEFNPPWVSWLQKALNSQLDFIHDVKRHNTQNISGVRREKQEIQKDLTYLLKFIQNLLKMVTTTRKPHCLERCCLSTVSSPYKNQT